MLRKKPRTSPVSSDAETEVRSPACERVAGNEDILHHICFFLGHRELASFARSRKGFFKPAVSHLWSTLKNSQFNGLFRLLPASLYERSGRALPVVQADDLRRWRLYTRYIRSIELDDSFSLPRTADIQILQSLALAIPRNSLFPRLTNLGVVFSPENLEILTLLLCPSLRSVCLLGMPNDEDTSYPRRILELEEAHQPRFPFDLSQTTIKTLTAFLDFLPTHSPGLHQLHFLGVPSRSHETSKDRRKLRTALSECLQALPELLDVRLDGSMALSIISSLDAAEKLECLTLEPTCHLNAIDPWYHGYYDVTAWPQVADLEPPRTSQCQLAELNLILPHKPTFSPDLMIYLTPALRHLHITPSFEDAGLASPLVETVVHSCPKLAELTIAVHGAVPRDFWGSLEGLRALSLEGLGVVIFKPGSVSNPNERLITLVSGHRTIRKVAFDVRWGNGRNAGRNAARQPTLSCLLSIAESCPKLTDLRLGSLFSSGGQWREHRPERKAFKRLRVADCHVEAPALAEFVATVWPNGSIQHNKAANDMVQVVRRVNQIRAGGVPLGV